MKLLLVEDERLTREGIMESVDWTRLGVSEVKEAADGIEALAVAESFAPDLVLTDIKMPRMDGVSFAFQIRRKYPHCKIVFMSGYAEKEYLKAAITLKAVSYVEKPLDIEELEEALANAAALHEEESRQLQMVSLSREKQHLLKQKIALKLIRPQWNQEEIAQETAWLTEPVPLLVSGAACIVKTDRRQLDEAELGRLLEASASEYGFRPLFAFKDDLHLVIHLLSEDRHKLSGASLKAYFAPLTRWLKERNVRGDAAIGRTAPQLAELHDSYMTAVLTLQESFYRGPYSIRLYGDSSYPAAKEVHPVDPKLPDKLKETLYREQFAESERLLRQLVSDVKYAPGTPVNEVKELIYRLLLAMEQVLQELGSGESSLERGTKPGWERIADCFYLSEAESILLSKLQSIRDIRESQQRGSGYLASRIIKYVHLHYASDELSVQTISDHLQLTPSHVISMFKEATGKTVKQYVLEYRMDRAKELLKQGSYKIADIAGQVGFKDGEYFAKVFRKFTGMTPSEYRERFQA